MNSCVLPLSQGFIGKLILEELDGDKWKLYFDFGYVTKANDIIRVKQGFVTDFASVPWPATLLIPKSGAYNEACVLHDWLYQNHKRLKITRGYADYILGEVMEYQKINPIIRCLIFRNVRMFGWAVWNRYDKKEIA